MNMNLGHYGNYSSLNYTFKQTKIKSEANLEANNKPDKAKPLSHFQYDSGADCWRTFGKGIYKKGDLISFKDANGVIVNGSVRELDGQLVIDFGDRGLFYDKPRGTNGTGNLGLY